MALFLNRILAGALCPRSRYAHLNVRSERLEPKSLGELMALQCLHRRGQGPGGRPTRRPTPAGPAIVCGVTVPEGPGSRPAQGRTRPVGLGAAESEVPTGTVAQHAPTGSLRRRRPTHRVRTPETDGPNSGRALERRVESSRPAVPGGASAGGTVSRLRR
jgi:hypothetical protein